MANLGELLREIEEKMMKGGGFEPSMSYLTSPSS